MPKLDRSSAQYVKLLGRPKEGQGEIIGTRAAGEVTREATSELAFPSSADWQEKIALLMETSKQYLDSIEGDTSDQDEQTRAIIDVAPTARNKLETEGSACELSEIERASLEAIIVLDGTRPSLYFEAEDNLNINGNLGMWDAVIQRDKDNIEETARSVGRVNLNGQHVGTGYVVAEGWILTNRHVLEGVSSRFKDNRAEFKGEVSISFGADGNSKSYTCLPDNIFAGLHAINGTVNFNHLDFALIPCNLLGEEPFPNPIALELNDDQSIEGRDVYTVGYPGPPRPGKYYDDVLYRLFGYKYGIKRISPGKIDASLGSLSEDYHKTVFGHDCTTLGGSSGSPNLVSKTEGLISVGLHFSGEAGEANYAHTLAALERALESRGIEFPASTS